MPPIIRKVRRKAMTATRIDKATASKFVMKFQKDLQKLRVERENSSRKFLIDEYIEYTRIAIKGAKKGLLISAN